MIANPYSQYRDVQVQTASPGRLLVMLYDGAIRFANQAKCGIEARDPKGTYEGLRRTQDIIDYLTTTLDMSAGEIAGNLAALYDFMGRHLVEANLHRDVKAVDEVIGLLQNLRMAYAEISGPAQAAAAPTPAVSAAPPIAARTVVAAPTSQPRLAGTVL